MNDAMRAAGPYLGLGLQLATSVLAFVLLGYWGDRLLGTEPWLFLVGSLLGVTAFIVRIVYLVRKV